MEEKKEEKEQREDDQEPEAPLFIRESLAQFWQRGILTDVVFQIGSEKFSAHRIVLSAFSPVFDYMLYPRDSEGKPIASLSKGPLQVKLDYSDAKMFKTFLHFIYTDEVDVDSDNIGAIMKLADRYQVDKLKAHCSEFLEQDVNLDNVIDLFIAGPSLTGTDELGFSFIEENATEVLKSDNIGKLNSKQFAKILKSDRLEISEAELFNVLKKWGELQITKNGGQGDLKETCKDLIGLIRYPLMQISDLGQISQSGFLEAENLLALFSYVSVTDESLRPQIPFNTTPRQGDSKDVNYKSPLYGGSGGTYFDEANIGKGMQVAKITVKHGGQYIDSIQMEYRDKKTNKSNLGVCYGGGGGGNKSDVITLGPSECITAVEIWYGGFLNALRFISNKGTTWNFGTQSGTSQKFAPKRGRLEYILGRSGAWMDAIQFQFCHI